MINISFDNPYLLLLIIPLAALVIVPYCIAIRKENKSKAATFALISHLVIVVLVVLAAAGMSNVTVITETELYVLADASASTDGSIEFIDDCIFDIEKNLPRNTEMGVITFGKNYRLHTPLGEKYTSIKNNKVNDSATDIVSALKYTDSLFGDSAIKRIILITDGMSTDPDATGELVRIIDDMKSRGVYIDTIYVDSNMKNGAKELQVSSVDFNASTYLGHKTTADVLVESSFETDAIATLTKNGAVYLEKAVKLTAGYNIINFDLDTSSEGEFDYDVIINSTEDSIAKNNSHKFTQKVNKTIKILLITDDTADINTVRVMYGDNAEIDSCVKPSEPPFDWSNPNPKPVTFNVPFTVEELCKYDEIIISDVDVRAINNSETFIKSLDTVVSSFGKSLITAGNTRIQNQEDQSLKALEDMLPVKFGNDDTDPQLFTLLIDTSRSMQIVDFQYFEMAKASAQYLLGIIEPTDHFAIIRFSGDSQTIVTPRPATEENVKEALAKIATLEVTQGTMIGAALDRAGEVISGAGYSKNQILLISDGMSFEGAGDLDDDPQKSAEILNANNIKVSTIVTTNTQAFEQGKLNPDQLEYIYNMEQIALKGGGSSHMCGNTDDLKKLMLEDISDEFNGTVIEEKTPVIIKKPNDDVLIGIEELPDIYGYVYTSKKASAETVLCVQYENLSEKVDVPLYAYWSYGKGRVATLATTLSGAWSSAWSAGEGLSFLENVAETCIPEQRIDYPYTVNIEYDGKYSHIEIIPSVLNPDATMTVTVIMPDGSEMSEKLIFDSYRYFYKIETGLAGKYRVKTTYALSTVSYSSESTYSVSYSPEYDSFRVYSPAAIYTFMRNNGLVYEDSDVDFSVDDGKVATYVLKFTVPFLAAAVALYIIDTLIRKLRWADIKSVFSKKSKEVSK